MAQTTATTAFLFSFSCKAGALKVPCGELKLRPGRQLQE